MIHQVSRNRAGIIEVELSTADISFFLQVLDPKHRGIQVPPSSWLSASVNTTALFTSTPT